MRSQSEERDTEENDEEHQGEQNDAFPGDKA